MPLTRFLIATQQPQTGINVYNTSIIFPNIMFSRHNLTTTISCLQTPILHPNHLFVPVAHTPAHRAKVIHNSIYGTQVQSVPSDRPREKRTSGRKRDAPEIRR